MVVRQGPTVRKRADPNTANISHRSRLWAPQNLQIWGPLGPAWRQKQNWKSSESEIPEVFRKERLNLISKLSNWLATRQHSAAVEFPAISGPESLQNTQVWVWVNSVDGTSGIFSLTQWISWRSNWKPIFFQYPKMWTALNLCLNMDLTLTNIPLHWNSYLTQLNVSSQG